MRRKKHIQTRYGKGSTGFHTAFPPRLSDGRSGGVPLKHNTPTLRKPAVLATRFPEPSQGTPGTAICAVIYHSGPALSRQQRRDGGVEQPPANRWKAMIVRIKVKVKQWQAQIHRYFLAHMRNHLAQTTKLAFGFIRLIALTIGILRRLLFRKPALPYGAINVSVHDRRYAVFRRRAVLAKFPGIILTIPILPGQLLGTGGEPNRY